MSTSIVLIPLVLLLGAIVQGACAAIGAHRKGPSERLLGLLGVAAPAIAFVAAASLFLRLDLAGQVAEVNLGRWIHAGGLAIDLVFRVDHLTVVMLLVITGIGSLIHLYSTAYMHGDPAYARYFACLNLFTFFMTVLVLAGDLIVLFVGWEGVGLCSYLLIGFWWSDAAKAQAGLKAFVVNRIGDAAFVLGGFQLWKTLGTLDLSKIHEMVQTEGFAAKLLEPSGLLGFSIATVIGILLFIGATGKSAQIPLYVWLPDAMAGPTPVSALIHAATMVTAGVYMIGRLNGVFALSPTAQGVVVIVASLTCLLAAGMALVQTDIKKVLAYSTVSQLGYMFIGVGTGAISAGVFHLVTHAFFKACLFLGAGSIIHALHHEQDLRRMGGLSRRMPWTMWTMLISATAMAGIPPLAGFFSKDEILWKAWESGGAGRIAWVLGSISALATAFYIFRLIFLAFGGNYRGERHAAAHGHDAHGAHGHASVPFNQIHESPWQMVLPLVVLASGAGLIGLLGVPHVLGGHDRFGEYLKPVLASPHPGAHGAHAAASEHSGGAVAVETALMLLAVGIGVLGIAFAHRFYVARPSLPASWVAKFPALHARLVALFGVDEFYDRNVVAPLRKFADDTLHQRIDVKIVERIVNGSGVVARRFASAVSALQDGSIQNYLTWMVMGTLLLLLTLLA